MLAATVFMFLIRRRIPPFNRLMFKYGNISIVIPLFDMHVSVIMAEGFTINLNKGKGEINV